MKFILLFLAAIAALPTSSPAQEALPTTGLPLGYVIHALLRENVILDSDTSVQAISCIVDKDVVVSGRIVVGAGTAVVNAATTSFSDSGCIEARASEIVFAKGWALPLQGLVFSPEDLSLGIKGVVFETKITAKILGGGKVTVYLLAGTPVLIKLTAPVAVSPTGIRQANADMGREVKEASEQIDGRQFLAQLHSLNKKRHGLSN